MCELARDKVGRCGFAEDSGVSPHGYQLLDLYICQTHFSRRRSEHLWRFLEVWNWSPVTPVYSSYTASDIQGADKTPGRMDDNLEMG